MTILINIHVKNRNNISYVKWFEEGVGMAGFQNLSLFINYCSTKKRKYLEVSYMCAHVYILLLL